MPFRGSAVGLRGCPAPDTSRFFRRAAQVVSHGRLRARNGLVIVYTKSLDCCAPSIIDLQPHRSAINSARHFKHGKRVGRPLQ